MVKAVIRLDVPDWQIGQEVTVYFRDTMKKKGLCEKQDDRESVVPILKRVGRNRYFSDYVCPYCDEDLTYPQNYCSECGRFIEWE